MYLFFDTETTGLPKDYNAPAKNTDNFPRVVQLAWVLISDQQERIASGNHIIKPEGFEIPEESSKIHGITQVIALEKGEPLKDVLKTFAKAIIDADVLVAHNINFDWKVMGAEFYRAGVPMYLDDIQKLCTMMSTINFVQAPGSYGFKYPKLVELHKKLFDCDFEGAHDASNDIEATIKCFWKLRDMQLI